MMREFGSELLRLPKLWRCFAWVLRHCPQPHTLRPSLAPSRATLMSGSAQGAALPVSRLASTLGSPSSTFNVHCSLFILFNAPSLELRRLRMHLGKGDKMVERQKDGHAGTKARTPSSPSILQITQEL